MEVRTADDLEKAGALALLCNYQDLKDVAPGDWTETRIFAIRTWRDVPIAEIDHLIERCIIAKERAQLIMCGRDATKCGQ
jgi:hypothetical protein